MPLRRLALRFAFELTTDDDDLARVARSVFADLPVAEHAAHTVRVVGNPRERYAIFADGQSAIDDVARSEVIAILTWLLNQGAISHDSDLLLLHAAVLANGEDGVLVAAPSGSGKSTLAAGLLTRGFDYLSDEVGALDLASMRLHAYPKPLSLEASSLDQLGLYDHLDPALGRWMSSKWQLPAQVIRSGSTPSSCAPRVAVFPQLVTGGESQLLHLRRSEAMALLVANSFNLVKDSQRRFEACAELCRQVECYVLTVAEARDACALVCHLLGASSPVGASVGSTPR